MTGRGHVPPYPAAGLSREGHEHVATPLHVRCNKLLPGRALMCVEGDQGAEQA
jgi:hypothetical protein